MLEQNKLVRIRTSLFLLRENVWTLPAIKERRLGGRLWYVQSILMSIANFLSFLQRYAVFHNTHLIISVDLISGPVIAVYCCHDSVAEFFVQLGDLC